MNLNGRCRPGRNYFGMKRTYFSILCSYFNARKEEFSTRGEARAVEEGMIREAGERRAGAQMEEMDETLTFGSQSSFDDLGYGGSLFFETNTNFIRKKD